jgi:hypothetical protein
MIAFTYLVVALLALHAAMGQPRPRDNKRDAAVKADIKYVRCQTCERIVEAARNATKDLRDALTKGKRVRQAAGRCRLMRTLHLA